MGGDAAGGDNSGDSARGTQAQRGRNNAGLGSGGETTSQVDSFRAFSAPPAQQPTGFDAGRGPSVTGAGNGTLGTSTSSITNIIDLDPLASLAKVAPPNPGDSARGTQAQRGRNNAGAGSGNNATGTLLGEVEELDVPVSGVDKLGNNSIPNGTNLSALDNLSILAEANPVKSALVAAAPLGTLALTGIANTPKVAEALGFDRPIAGHQDNFQNPNATKPSTTPGPSPFGDDGGGSDGGGSSPNIRRRVNAPTPQAAGSTAAQPQNLSFLQRLERQRGRAASSSTGASGQGRYASRTLLGT